jgi:threonine aldolase
MDNLEKNLDLTIMKTIKRDGALINFSWTKRICLEMEALVMFSRSKKKRLKQFMLQSSLKGK